VEYCCKTCQNKKIETIFIEEEICEPWSLQNAYERLKCSYEAKERKKERKKESLGISFFGTSEAAVLD